MTPQEWENQFRKQPENLASVTKVICTHPFHGTEIFFVSVEQWHDNIRALLSRYWINGYTIILQPCDF